MTTKDNNAKELLLEELSSNSINILRIRQICLENPGVIASAGIRIRVWSLLLLGTISYDTSSASFHHDLSLEEIPNESCDEQHVLEADVKRTRADMDEFRSTAYRQVITIILQSFCLKHNIQYKQGMNEVLAAFVYINPPITPAPHVPPNTLLTFALFEAFLFRYLERYFCVDDSSYLYKSFRYFQILLVYHDPQLALFLSDNDFYPELYAPQWFLTFYSRSLPIPYVLRLWDMIIAVDDTAFMFFIGLCLLKRFRHVLLKQNSDTIPEVITLLINSINNEQDIDSIMKEALDMYKLTPRCFIRNLRLCCSSNSSIDLKPTNFNNNIVPSNNTTTASTSSYVLRNSNHTPSNKELNNNNNNNNNNTTINNNNNSNNIIEITRKDVRMAEQSVRKTIMMSPQELITYLAPLIQSDDNINNTIASAGAGASNSTKDENIHAKLIAISMSSNNSLNKSNHNIIDSTCTTTNTTIDMSTSNNNNNNDNNSNNNDTTNINANNTTINNDITATTTNNGACTSAQIPQPQQQPQLQQLPFVLIDIRSPEEIEMMGGGIIPKAVALEPEFLDNPQGR